MDRVRDRVRVRVRVRDRVRDRDRRWALAMADPNHKFY